MCRPVPCRSDSNRTAGRATRRRSRAPAPSQVVTRSFTSSTSRSTACTPCFAAVAPCCSTVVATRLMRVTGDCLRAARVVLRFDADDPRAVFFFAAVFDAAARLVFVFAAALPREPARFVADFRALPPDDFVPVAIFSSSEGRYARLCARFARNDEPVVCRDCCRNTCPPRKITCSLRIATSNDGSAAAFRDGSPVSRQTPIITVSAHSLRHSRPTSAASWGVLSHLSGMADRAQSRVEPAECRHLDSKTQAHVANEVWRGRRRQSVVSDSSTRAPLEQGSFRPVRTDFAAIERRSVDGVVDIDTVARGDGGTDRSSTARVERTDQFGL